VASLLVLAPSAYMLEVYDRVVNSRSHMTLAMLTLLVLAVFVVMEVPVSLVFLVLIFAMSPVLGWSAVAAAMIQTFIAWLNQRSTQPPLLAANRSAVAAQQYADGSLRNAQVIESMG